MQAARRDAEKECHGAWFARVVKKNDDLIKLMHEYVKSSRPKVASTVNLASSTSSKIRRRRMSRASTAWAIRRRSCIAAGR